MEGRYNGENDTERGKSERARKKLSGKKRENNNNKY